jgi:polysaccharide pyruvyl transferase CsaB
MTKYVISGYIGFDNFGDEAIASVLTSYLKAKNADCITVLSSNPIKTSKLYNVQSAHYLNFLMPILKSDVLISGGGSLLQDITSLKSLLYYLLVILTGLILNKKVIIFAQGFTPFRTTIGKFFTRFILKYCDKIYVRDMKSYEILQGLSLNSEIITDPVFGMIIPNCNEKHGIGIQLRSFPTISNNFLNKLSDMIKQKFPNQTLKLYSLQDSIDLPIIEKFVKFLNQKSIKYKIYKNLDINTTINEISKLEYLIGMRFHANLVASKAGVKVLGINYDIKVQSLSQTIGFPIIELDDNDFEKEFNKLINIDPQEYKIPDFKFPTF